MPTTRILDLPSQSATHAHPEHQLVLGLNGCADFEVDGTGGAVSRLHACIVPGDAAHAFSGRGENRMLILDVAMQEFTDAGLKRLFDRPRFLTLDSRLLGLLDFAGVELGRHGSDTPVAWHLGNTVLHAISQQLSSYVPSPRAALDIEVLRRYVMQHLDKPISVRDLARQVHVSPSHFHALFRQATGHTPHHFVQICRVRQAADWLRETRLPIAEVASRSGFCSQSALTHATRRHLGLTPGAIRQGVAAAS
ncbi:helix-turn-helix domain-containing protein [Halopseudomonas nanhaiensis]|uniref:AraC family transcriptional regulator n=1 Tax=Halopseudomonas nanhaiensis TaxID=2830842 RepID=UPI001CC0EBEC|nr:AraC family transcriptional regulator [Halopseudomonas nanhaiensis]UAW99755.1 helix-turn-helix domain-containing protein [Halopseudomonas nanhaiensis]